MVLCGGLELVALGYVIHKHQKNKRERELLKGEVAALEEQQYPLQERPHRHTHSNSHSLDRQESREERRERHRRRRSKERREREKWEFEHGGGREYMASPKIHAPHVRPPIIVAPGQTQTPQPNGYPPTGWPSNWKQAHTPPTPIPLAQPNGYPQDVKYGFVPEIPHEEYPPYPPPPFSPNPSGRDSRGRSSTLDVNDGRRGRPTTRRSVSPRLGVYDEYSRSPTPRVRFSTEDVVLGEGRGVKSPPPKYRA